MESYNSKFGFVGPRYFLSQGTVVETNNRTKEYRPPFVVRRLNHRILSTTTYYHTYYQVQLLYFNKEYIIG